MSVYVWMCTDAVNVSAGWLCVRLCPLVVLCIAPWCRDWGVISYALSKTQYHAQWCAGDEAANAEAGWGCGGSSSAVWLTGSLLLKRGRVQGKVLFTVRRSGTDGTGSPAGDSLEIPKFPHSFRQWLINHRNTKIQRPVRTYSDDLFYRKKKNNKKSSCAGLDS